MFSPLNHVNQSLLTRRSFIAAGCTAAVAIALRPSQAFAVDWSTPVKKTINGVTYSYQSGVVLGANPTAYTRITASKTVAKGVMGARAVIIRENGVQIVASSIWKKNEKGTSVTQSYSSSTLKLGFQSRGRVTIQGVDGQLTCNPIKGRASRPPLPRNGNGQTLGTYEDTEYGYEPDLLAIVADSGAEGYALYEQFMAEELPGSIPVYAEDGCTEIGTFTFGNR